jgi:hypothetical protein
MSLVTILKPGGDYGSIYNIFDEEIVAEGEHVISDAIPLHSRSSFGIWYKIHSVLGTPTVRLFYDMGSDKVSGHFVLPASGDNIEDNLTDKNGIVVQYVGSESDGTVQVTTDGIILCAPTLTMVQTLLFSDYPTITQMVAGIDALTDWTCSNHADMSGDEMSAILKLTAPTACKSDAVTLKAELPVIKSLTLTPMPLLRLRALGLSGTPSDTTLDVRVFVQ